MYDPHSPPGFARSRFVRKAAKLLTFCLHLVLPIYLQRLYEVSDWAERYRSRNEGTFPGTGPTIYRGVTYFTDNTYPVMLWAHSYNLFSKALQDTTSTTSSSAVAPMRRVAINKPGTSRDFVHHAMIPSFVASAGRIRRRFRA
jgi:hypothetical protein